ncbi:tRNA-dependent cyclodipeptide synthase [Priestia filamentosa]|uniref:tRNA-dependent cyclodipeptide synthase n=1 Tax=Priestia filamentosa TaxID=1402861 RepID=UPI00398276BE
MTQVFLEKLATKLFNAHHLSKNCENIFNRRKHLLIGISPFNSRFSEEYIYRLIEWGTQEFKDVSVLLAGNEAANLLEALGTPRIKAERKVRKEVNRNRRFAERALAANGGNPESICTFSDFDTQPIYSEMRREIENAFLNQPNFRNACLEMSHAAILGRASGTNMDISSISDEMLNTAVQYVLAELPFFIGAPDILGIEETVLAYHKPWKLGEQIKAEQFSIKMQKNQGYIVVDEIR